MSGQFPPKKLSVAILSRLCYLQRRLDYQPHPLLVGEICLGWLKGLEHNASWGRPSKCLLVTNVYYNFQNGHHVIRRSGQVLVCAVNRYHHCICSHGRSTKSRWGLTRGRGMNEVHRLVCLLGMPACFLVNLSQQTFTGVQFKFSE